LNEILQSWCYAQELETIEHAFMNVVTTLFGQVRLYTSDVKTGGILIRYPKDVNVDLEDDVSTFPETPRRKLTDKAAHCALGSALSTI
jgi:hypothetical protein